MVWFIFAILGSCLLQVGAEENNAAFSIAGYLPDYRFYINVNQTAIRLSDLLLFSVSPRPQLGAKMMLRACCLNENQYDTAYKASIFKQDSTGTPLRLWVTVGGGGRSDNFLAKPKNLIDAMLALATDYKLYGIDLDCESFRTQEEYDHYMQWIGQAADSLHEAGLQVSVALHAGQLLPEPLYRKIDRVNLMTYDMSGEYHAAISQTRGAVEKLMTSGCDSRKIMLGIPAYARNSAGGVKTFSELWDAATAQGLSTSEFLKLNTWDSYQFESPSAVKEKVRLAKSLNLGGVFFWELGQDKQAKSFPGGVLLQTAAIAVSHSGGRTEL